MGSRPLPAPAWRRRTLVRPWMATLTVSIRASTTRRAPRDGRHPVARSRPGPPGRAAARLCRSFRSRRPGWLAGGRGAHRRCEPTAAARTSTAQDRPFPGREARFSARVTLPSEAFEASDGRRASHAERRHRMMAAPETPRIQIRISTRRSCVRSLRKPTRRVGCQAPRSSR